MSTIGDIHTLKVAEHTLRMAKKGIKVMSGMTEKEARDFLDFPKPKTKRWISPIPKNCDICHKSLANEEIFVDGKTRSGRWAIMCVKCFRSMGVGIGTGKGQVYKLPTGEKIGG